MPKRYVLSQQGRRFVVLPYTGFRHLGIATDPEVPRVAVPLYDTVEEALAEPLAESWQHREMLAANGIAGVASLLASLPGQAPAPRAGSRAAADVTYEDKIHFPFVFFRGEAREEHGLMPVMFRRITGTTPDEQDHMIAQRRREEARAARRTRWRSMLSLRGRLTEMQARAAARHYGAMSSMLDFTFDPRIAAYFSHPSYREHERQQANDGIKPMGIIYGMSYARLQEALPTQGWGQDGSGGPSINFYSIGSTIEVPYLSADTSTGAITPARMLIDLAPVFANNPVSIRTAAVPSVRRIKAQEGLFIDLSGRGVGDWRCAFALWYLLDFICDKWCFYRRDQQYEDRAGGITASALFPG